MRYIPPELHRGDAERYPQAIVPERSQPARTASHSRWETEMQLRREQKEEQATETEVIIYETEQQQGHKIKNDKKRKEITKPNHTALSGSTNGWH
jgi:hypothetical protein